MNSDFRDLISLLALHEVKYLVIGGYAVMLCSEPRFTKELDVFIGITIPNIDRFACALSDFRFQLDKRGQRSPRSAKQDDLSGTGACENRDPQ